MLQYFINTRRSGNLLLALPWKHEKGLISISGGITFVIFGLFQFILRDPFTTPKSYAFGALCISLGIFGVISRIRYSQLREKGILSENGKLYHWENIENFSWKFGEDKLTLTLNKSIFSHNINLRLHSQFRQEVVAYMSRNIGNKG
jgi:hypothetical protein